MTRLEALPAFGMFNRERQDSYWPKSQCVDGAKWRKLVTYGEHVRAFVASRRDEI